MSKSPLAGILLVFILNFMIHKEIAQSEQLNRLGAEKSPYLLQHKDNPVHWYAWGKDAFSAAEKENKAIFLSIGYSTCYWCHVMEKDSFEMQQVADVLNANFISIKVDREERPDVDKIYMDAVTSLTGRGGWPMSVFLTPDGKPFYGGTFFYREQFIGLLEQVSKAWKTKQKDILFSASKITEAIAKTTTSNSARALGDEIFQKAFFGFNQSFDSTDGGFGNAPKFPSSEALSLLLRIHRKTQNPQALKITNLTLEKMARGGIYDHLGGGFARYSTDAQWLVPHFEKMLYSNAGLTIAYLEALQVTNKQMYAEVARETLNYVIRDMRDTKGGFYSAEDAGEVEKEGEYYVWKESEFKSALNKDEFNLFKKVYGITTEGNFEHQNNIISLSDSEQWSTKTNPIIKSAHTKLLAARGKRTPPHKDDKVLTAWNGLMISAFSKGYQLLDDKHYLDAAKQSASFIKNNLYRNKKLLRRYRDNESGVAGYLDDYAFLIEALINLYESDFDTQWMLWAIELQKKQDELFWDEKGFGYFFTAIDDPNLIIRKKDYNDGALPSGNSVSFHNLLRLYHFTFEKSYNKRALELLSAMSEAISTYPSAHARALLALDYHLDTVKEIVVVGKLDSETARAAKKFLYKSYLPNKVIAFGEPAEIDDTSALAVFRGRRIMNEKTTIYVCENNTCKQPTNDFEVAKKLISGTH